MSDIKEPVKTVIQVLHDSHKGFSDIGEHLKDPTAKRFFMEEAGTRHKFEHELKSAVGATEDVGGTVAGPVHRARTCGSGAGKARLPAVAGTSCSNTAVT